ncbi:MAG TPA: hypothetical protein VLC98_14995 [Phnomibacter sp.]|nr:hypothetical protein [Phnomibacter sp.]
MLRRFNSFQRIMVVLICLCVGEDAAAQKTVSAVINFSGKDTAVQLGKNQTFVWELWVPNRKGYE